MSEPKKKTEAPLLTSPEPAAVFVALDALHEWADNPRQNADAVKDVARSIRRFGFASPIIARRENGEIIAGHTRYLAAKRLRLKEVPVRYLDIDEREAHALALADNKLGEAAKWDNDLLGKVLAELQADDVDLEIGMGFSDRELDRLIATDDDDGAKAADEKGKRTGRALGGLQYRIVIDCKDEDDQTRLLEWLERENVSCRPLMS